MSENRNDPDRHTGEWLNPDEHSAEDGNEEIIKALFEKLWAREKSIEIAAEKISEHEAIQRDLRDFMSRIALRLARCGGEAHKEKNEVLLSAIADLLSVSRNPVEYPGAHYGEHPF